MSIYTVRLIVLAGSAAVVVAGLSIAQTAAPIARYEMLAGTTSGLLGGMAGMNYHRRLDAAAFDGRREVIR